MVEKVRLGKIAKITTGQSAPQGDDNYCSVIDGGVPFVKAGNLEFLSKGGCLASIQAVPDNVVKSHKLQLFPKGSVVFAKSGMSCLKGYIYVLAEACYLVSHLAAITPNSSVTPQYLKYYFEYHPPSKLIQNMSYPSIKVSDIEKTEIPSISLSEQQHIVSVLDTVNSLIDARKKQIALLDEAEKSLFVEMFGKDEQLYSWKKQLLEDVADVKVGVVIKPRQYYTDAKNGTKAFRSLNVGENRIKDNDWIYFSTDGQVKNKKSILKEGDVLVVRSGNPGTACVVTKEYEGCNAVDLIIATPNPQHLTPQFLCMFTNSESCKKEVEAKTKGGAQQHFNVGSYKTLSIPLPPIHLQKEFSTQIEKIEEQRINFEQGLAKLEEEYKALMQEYFE